MSSLGGAQRSTLPIVIGGCHRSGTSLLRRILDTHPRIYCGPEVKFLRDFHGTYVKDPIRHVRFLASARAMLPEEELFELLGSAFIEMHERAARRAGKPRWADKNPENIVFLEAWRKLLGERWLLVHVVRNPLDTLASIKEWPFRVSIPEQLDERIEMYLDYTRAGLEFAAISPDRCYRLVYEQLVTRPEGALGALMAWLGEDFHPAQLRMNDVPHQTGLEDPKVAETTEPHAESIGRWRDVLSSAEASTIQGRTSAVWREIDPHGYWAAPERGSLSRS